MSNATTELARREARAQHGIIEFAEEMQAIRDNNLYPGAKQTPDAWKVYCKERWGQSSKTVDETIRAAPVLRRRTTDDGVARGAVSVNAATVVATLPEKVQDAILDTTEKRDDVKAKAKAARQVVKQVQEREGRDATDEELIEAAAAVKPKPKPKAKRKHSKFSRHLEAAYYEIQVAADVAQGDVLSDVENDYGWNRVEKIAYELERIKEKLYQPEFVKDPDEAFAELLGGEER